MEKIVFTNGCFDVLHPGHIDLLRRARSLGSRLIVGINSDRSVRAIKGPDRPLMGEEDRRTVLLGLESVDEVLIFDEPTPERLIREISPNVLVKGGDWAENEIVGAHFVRSKGGEVHSLPLLGSYSTSAIVGRMAAPTAGDDPSDDSGKAAKSLAEHLQVLSRLADVNLTDIEDTASELISVLESGGKILVCGNGGSAADAQHFAAELVGRFESSRRGLAAIALTTDTSALTAIANDYSFESIFKRQVESLGRTGDALVAISTSGNSPNVIAAVMTARGLGMKTIGLTGSSGKKLASLCDRTLMVPSARTSRIQEAHSVVIHLWCELIDDWAPID